MRTARPATRTRGLAAAQPGRDNALSGLLTRHPSDLALAGMVIGGVARRRWIFLSALAAWLFLQERKGAR